MNHRENTSCIVLLIMTALLVSFKGSAQIEQEFQVDSLVNESSLDYWSATVWGQYRSNAVDHEFGNTLLRGGSINRDLIESALVQQNGDMGSFGFSSGGIFSWSSKRLWRDTKARVCGSIQARALIDARWTPEMFELFFLGNQGHLGRWDYLSGSQFRSTAWGTAMIGLEGRNNNRIELGLAFRKNQTVGRIHSGFLKVSESADSLYVLMRANASVDSRPSLGLALNGEWHFMREDAPFAFHVKVQNLGWVVVPKGGKRYRVDTLLETTGLAIEGPGWSIESWQSDGLGAELLRVDTAGVTLQRLPARCDVAMEYPLGPRSGWDIALQIGEWMPAPRVIMGYRRAFGKQWQVGIQGIVGGWGRLRPAVWARNRLTNDRVLTFFVEDPWGWGSSSGFGRGLTLRFEGF